MTYAAARAQRASACAAVAHESQDSLLSVYCLPSRVCLDRDVMLSACDQRARRACKLRERPRTRGLGADDVMLGPGSGVQSSLLAHGRGTTTECETGSDVGDEDDEARGAHPITARGAGLHMLHVRQGRMLRVLGVLTETRISLRASCQAS